MTTVPTQPFLARLEITGPAAAEPLSPRLFGNFMEHLGYAVDGGVLAHALANPIFERDPNLHERQVQALLEAGMYLAEFTAAGRSPQVFPDHWSPGIGATGFGVCALDDYRGVGVPFPWAPLEPDDLISASVGRIGGAVRLRPKPAKDRAASGIRQGIFLPFQRCLGYHGIVWARIAALDGFASGTLEVALQRRPGGEPAGKPAGELLAQATLPLSGNRWTKASFQLQVDAGQVSAGEPVDFTLRWLPETGASAPQDLLIDQALLLPDDAVDGIFDPDVLRLVREWNVPLLRWPGGNFASYYHWRDGTGEFDRRPYRKNDAWGGLDYNFFGTAEFIHFCRLAGAEPHITVNTGTGTAEEAAGWVAFCNASADTPMGRLRAAQGDPEPYRVRLWEVGNETYGSWQGGYHGADENALRCQEFAGSMRSVDPQIELIATGNQFDIALPGAHLDHTNADRMWNRRLLESSAATVDYLSLHCLPANDILLEHLSDEQAYYSLMAQPVSWERAFLPGLAGEIARHTPPGRAPAGIAITEWGILGRRGSTHPVVENYGEVLYAGLFLNMVIRSHRLVKINNATALLHGGCIRKAGGQVFYDPQYTVIREYTQLAGGYLLDSQLDSPAYDAPDAPDLGLPLEQVPYVDAVAVRLPGGGGIACLVNRHRHQPARVRVQWPGGTPSGVHFSCLADQDITARARLGEPDRFQIQALPVQASGQDAEIELPPCSVGWLRFD